MMHLDRQHTKCQEKKKQAVPWYVMCTVSQSCIKIIREKTYKQDFYISFLHTYPSLKTMWLWPLLRQPVFSLINFIFLGKYESSFFFIQVFFVISHNPYSGKAPVVSCSFFRAENVEDPCRLVYGGIEVHYNLNSDIMTCLIKMAWWYFLGMRLMEKMRTCQSKKL